MRSGPYAPFDSRRPYRATSIPSLQLHAGSGQHPVDLGRCGMEEIPTGSTDRTVVASGWYSTSSSDKKPLFRRILLTVPTTQS